MYSHPQQGAGSAALDLRKQAGAWLRSLREGAGISQRDLARRVEIEYYTFISQIEAGRGRIPPDRYAAWADALGVDVKIFVKKLMSYYDPVTFGLLFPEELDANRP